MILKILFSLVLMSSVITKASSQKSITDDRARELYQKAFEYQRQGELDSAIIMLDSADQISPENSTILHERGLIKSNLRRYDEALVDINRSLALQDDERKLKHMVNNRALIYMEIGEMDKACEDWRSIGYKSYLRKYCK